MKEKTFERGIHRFHGEMTLCEGGKGVRGEDSAVVTTGAHAGTFDFC